MVNIRETSKYGTGLGSNLRPLYMESNTYLQPDTLQTALRGPIWWYMYGSLIVYSKISQGDCQLYSSYVRNTKNSIQRYFSAFRKYRTPFHWIQNEMIRLSVAVEI